MKTRLQKTGESLQEYASEVERLANLTFSNHLATVRGRISLQYFVDGLREGEVQKAVRMADVQDLKSALLYALKVEAANEASCRDNHSVRGARVTTDAPCASPWRKEIEKPREEIQDLLAQRQNLKRRRVLCWGCGGAGHPSENLRVEKKFGVIDPIVRKVTTPSTSSLDPWSDESVRKDQLADPEIKPIIEFKESSDEKPSWSQKRSRRQQLYNVGAPFEHIAFDILVSFSKSSDGNNNILVVRDYFTKWPEAYPISDQEASTVAEVLV
ncbi:uncharacterized protein TNCV_3068721 [Trichonephila clavipes]|nr:uncharacterized protein TNCV_3068721 [Trichonephila clavipes]